MTTENTRGRAMDPDEAIARERRTLEGVVGIPATEGNRITVLRNGYEIFPAMLDAIGAAEHTIDFLTSSTGRARSARRWLGLCLGGLQRGSAFECSWTRGDRTQSKTISSTR